MIDILIFILSTLGAVFILLAAIGLVRMPDLYLRISVSTKAVTLGVGLTLLSAALYFNSLPIISRLIAIIIFVFLTAPIGAHMIGRASYNTGERLWKNSVSDDLKGEYGDTNQLFNGKDNGK